MIQLSAAQWAEIEALYALDFVDQLLQTMTESRPECFIGLPRYVRRTMILNGIVLAERCGFKLRSSTAAFIALQCHAAPDFYLHPVIDATLKSSLPEQQCIDTILYKIPDQTWNEIRGGASPCAWFEPRQQKQVAVRTAARVCANFPELIKNNSEDALFVFFNSTLIRAAEHGIDWDEGLVVFAVALALYGPNLDQPGGPPWASKVFFPSASRNAKIVNLLRARIALDTNRLI